MNTLRLILVRVTQDVLDFVEQRALLTAGGKTAVLKKAAGRAKTATLRGDLKARKYSIGARLPESLIERLDAIAVARACSRTTILNSCLSSEARRAGKWAPKKSPGSLPE